MEEVSFEELINRAKNSTKWHFHMLNKGCKFNPNKERFCIILEDKKSKETFISFFDYKPLKESKKLAELMYGKEFLEKEGGGKHSKEFDAILKKAKELTKRGIEWHHHHLHPNCIFNEHRGKNCIILEDEKGKTLTAIYDGNPMKDLSKLEKLFYKDVLDRTNLTQMVEEIVKKANDLKNKHTSEKNALINYACIFCQNDEQYNSLMALAQEIGKVVEETPTGPLFRIQPFSPRLPSLSHYSIPLVSRTQLSPRN